MSGNQHKHHTLTAAGLSLNCSPDPNIPPHIMGVLNVTPDSFSDGGKYTSVDSALERASVMIAEGAAIIDVGGASSRPKGKTYGAGAEAVSQEEEISRVVPAVRAIASSFPDQWISIDTYDSVVADAAVAAGANMINDITGLRFDPRCAHVASKNRIPLVLMHSVGNPGEMPHSVEYDNAVLDVKKSLVESVKVANRHGATQLILDPGFGFGKTPADNLALISGINQFVEMGFPILAGISRKSTIGRVLSDSDQPVDVDGRLFGSLGATAVAALRGASIIRTHDIQPTFEMLRLLCATWKA